MADTVFSEESSKNLEAVNRKESVTQHLSKRDCLEHWRVHGERVEEQDMYGYSCFVRRKLLIK